MRVWLSMCIRVCVCMSVCVCVRWISLLSSNYLTLILVVPWCIGHCINWMRSALASLSKDSRVREKRRRRRRKMKWLHPLYKLTWLSVRPVTSYTLRHLENVTTAVTSTLDLTLTLLHLSHSFFFSFLFAACILLYLPFYCSSGNTLH